MRFSVNQSVVSSACAALAVAALLGGGRVSAAESSSEQYLSLRRTYPPRPGLTLRMMAAEPTRYRGMTVELEGRLVGTSRHDDDGDDASLLLSTAEGDLTLTMSSLPAWLQPGGRLRVLAVVTGAQDESTVVVGVPDMRVVAVASSSDIAAAEMRWEQTARLRAARAQRNEATLQAANAALTAAERGKGRSLRVTSVDRGGNMLASRSGGAMRSSSAFARGLSPAAQRVYPAYLAYVRRSNRRLSDREADAIASSILLFSERYGVDPRLVVSLIIAESDFHPSETSNKGAMGLGQLMPDEARTLGLSNPYDPVQNIAGAVYLLRGRLDKYSGGADLTMQHIILALASYNAGMGAVKKYGGVPPYRETQNYVKKIERIYRELCAGDGAS